MPSIPASILATKQASTLATKPLPPAVSTVPWTTKTVTVLLTNDVTGAITEAKVEAKIVGTLAVHKHADNDDVFKDHWLVTHVPTGMMVFVSDLEDEALKAAKWLWNKHCMLLRERTKEAVNAKVPEWFVPWLKGCCVAKRFSPPAARSEKI